MARTMRVGPMAGALIVVRVAVIAPIGIPRIWAGVRTIGIGTGIGIVAWIGAGVGVIAWIGAGVGIVVVVAIRRVAVAIVLTLIRAGGHDDGVQDDGAVRELHGAVVVD